MSEHEAGVLMSRDWIVLPIQSVIRGGDGGMIEGYFRLVELCHGGTVVVMAIPNGDASER